ncbi:hypothetical protein [uncultured Granulicatella sp.]|uniref:hypothetical protein n=1 Tax=uncultured Granulicatella sp. TaxID=316089 RepID=UPI00261420AA|nr:hypothetical protein [uncultured Granulicatella sp.]
MANRMRSVNVERLAKLLYYRFKSRYGLYRQLKESGVSESDLKIMEKSYGDHSFISEIGVETFYDSDYWIKYEELFVQNFNIKLNSKKRRQYLVVDYFSEKSLDLIDSEIEFNTSNFSFEHMVPKGKYIFNRIKEEAKKNISDDELQKLIYKLIDKYYYVALITREENKKLSNKGYKQKMPEDWDWESIKARYQKAGITICRNPIFEKM